MDLEMSMGETADDHLWGVVGDLGDAGTAQWDEDL